MIPTNSSKPISVIIPLYNKANFIARALNSVLKQTIQSFEIIVVGGKSIDGGEDIVRSYSDSRIKLIDEIGNGVSSARNQAVSIAKFDIVAFLDADDEWLPNHLEVILKLHDKYPESKAYATGYEFVSKDNVSKRVCRPKLGDRCFSYFAESTIAGLNKNIILLSCLAIKKDLFIEVGGFNTNLRYGEDMALYKYIAIKSKIAYSPEITAIYNYSTPNNTRCDSLKKDAITDTFMLKIEKMVFETQNMELIRDFKKYSEMTYVANSMTNALRGHRSDSYKLLHHSTSVRYFHLRCIARIINEVPNKIRVTIAKYYYKLD